MKEVELVATGEPRLWEVECLECTYLKELSAAVPKHLTHLVLAITKNSEELQEHLPALLVVRAEGSEGEELAWGVLRHPREKPQWR